jgi:hypothetical protein
MSDQTKQPDQTTSQADLASEVERLKQQNYNLQGKLADHDKKWGWAKDQDPDQIKGRLSDYEKMRTQSAGGDTNAINALIAEKEAEIQNRFSRKLTELETESANLKGEVKNLRVTSVAMQEAARFFNADGLPLLKPLIESQTDFVDGKIVVLENGKPRVSNKDPRNQMDVAEWLEILTKDYPSIAKSSVVGGAQPTGQRMSGSGTTLTANEYRNLSALDQQKYMRSLQPTEQRKLLNSLINMN